MSEAGATEDLPIHLAGGTMSPPRHACGFFRSRDDEYRVTMPFIREGLERGEKAFHIVRSSNVSSHLRRLAEAGIDVGEARSRGQLEILPWEDAYLHNGRFDPDAMLELMEDTLDSAHEDGFRLARVLGGAEWALEDLPGVQDLMQYETRLNYLLPHYDDAVTCTYDISRFGAAAAMDALRIHRMVVIGGFLVENPFFVPPDEMLDELRTRR